MKRGGMYARRVAVPARKAGRALLDIDEKYAKRVDKDLEGRGPIAQALGGTSLRNMGGADMGLKKDANIGERVAAGAMMATGIGTNLGYRYGLPTAGLTLAGKALMDLTQSYQTSGTIEPR